MYTLKSIVQRGTLFGAAAALVAAAVIPTAAVFADSLNPLTERSLLLSSSAPGWQDTDGSGFSETNQNPVGQYYAAPGTGPNGKKTGETFSFRVSTDSTVSPATPVKAFTLQYCTKAAGKCQAPGNNTGDARTVDPADGVSVLTPDRQDNATGHANQTSDFEAKLATAQPGVDYIITQTPAAGGVAQDVSANWTVSTANAEDNDFEPAGSNLGKLTGKDNLITLKHTTGISPAFNDKIEIKFVASSDNYLTNPGSDAFFVKINTYSSDTSQIGTWNDTTPLDESDHTVIDGGVTVANVMTDSIHITTKVLETMAFSVGTQNPDTQSASQHGSCDAITVVNNNRLDLGDPNAESSLETGQAFDAFSYWRLSSNSSGGATVYYSGDTLKSTVGDSIAPMGNPVAVNPADRSVHSQPGTEQFGLSLADAGVEKQDTGTFQGNHVIPNIAPLNPVLEYNGGGYVVGSLPNSETTPGEFLLPISRGVGTGNGTTGENGKFLFDANSKTVPALIAQNDNAVLSCATAKVRYVGNIAADTPAGVYTTKINFLAAPQY